MKKIFALLLTGTCLFTRLMAQDDLLGDLMKEDSAKVKQNYTTATFKSTKVINMESVEMTGAGNLQFMITHHFGNIWNKDLGAQNLVQLLGLNSGVAHTYLSLDYSVKSWLNFGAASTGNSRFEGWTKIRLLRQQTGQKNIPVTAVWMSVANVDASKNGVAIGESVWNRYAFMHQLLIARKFSEKFSLEFLPTLIHYNVIPYGINNRNNTYSMGVAARYKLKERRAVTFEYARQLNMYDFVIDKSGNVLHYNPNLVSLGYDMDTGGHIFQFFVSSSTGAYNIEQLTRNTNDFSKLQFSFGFNINRSFGVKKSVKN